MPSLVSNWKLDGFVDEQRYYCSETPIDPLNLPAPKDVLAGNVRTYTDADVEVGKEYYIAVGSVKNSIEKLSEQKQVGVGFWTPLNLPFEIVFVDADNVVVNSSNFVEQMTDMGGGNRHFIQNTENRRPLLIESSINTIRFDGSNDLLISSAANNFLAGKSCAWVFVVSKANVLKVQGIFGTRSANGAAGRFNVYAGTGNYSSKIGLLSRSTDNGASVLTYNTEDTTLNTRMILAYRDYTQTSQKVVIDDKNTYTTAARVGAISNTNGGVASIGAETNNGLSPFNGDIYCVLVGTSPLTQEYQDKLFGWAAHKYGLTANLPAGHPYKILVPII